MPEEFIPLVIFTGPAVSSLICLGMLLHARYNGGKEIPGRFNTVLVPYFFCFVFNWTSMLLYNYIPAVYVRLNIVFYLTCIIVQVFFYHFIFMLTRLPDGKRFSYIHYLIPLLLVLCFGIWSAFVPYEIKLHIVRTFGDIPEGYGAYGRVFTARLTLRTVWSLFYTILAWKRLLEYLRKVGDYSADIERSSLTWVKWLLLFTLTMLPLPATDIFFTRLAILRSLLPFIPIFFLIMQHSLVCYNTIVGNFVVIAGADNGTMPGNNAAYCDKDKLSRGISKEKFEQYMQQKKPWLEPRLRITDLCTGLHTNRTALSVFINTTYGMNFNRYINHLRLMEMRRLSALPGYENASRTQLALEAGFSSYRSYRMFLISEETISGKNS